jgi:signal transduction histidine kinase
MRLKWPWAAPQGLRIPSLRLYQQIVVLLLLVVLLPIGTATIAIYNINKRAMRKQLTNFSQQLAQAVYQDITTEMTWQERHLLTLQRVAKPDQSLPQAAATLFQLDDALEGVARYKADGSLESAVYRDFAKIVPEWRFPQQFTGSFQPDSALLPQPNRGGRKSTPPTAWFEVVYPLTENVVDGPKTYYLRGYLKEPTTATKTDSAPIAATEPGRILAFQRRFDYLHQLAVASQTSVHENHFLVNEQGLLMAGPAHLVQQKTRLSPKDFTFFRQLRPGVAAVFKTNVTDNWQMPNGIPLPPPPGVSPQKNAEAKEQILDTVFLKLPLIGWGIIIESPYHVQQHFIAQARSQTFFIMLAVLAVALLLGLIYVYGITRNFRQLIKGIKAISAGNYGRQIRLLTNMVTPYEIIFLAGEFNRMGRKINEGWQAIQQANQQLAQLDQVKSNLIDTVSHELRTPLTNIKGYTDRLLRHFDALEPEVRIKSLKVIKQQTERLTRLVEDLLVIPDLEQHRLRIYLDEVALEPLLERVLLPFKERADHRLEVVEVPSLSSVFVIADADRLEQVLVNLLDNAYKYSLPEGGVRLVVAVASKGAALSNQVALTVTNPCEPIAPADVPGLFAKFARLDDGLTRTTRGSGLGLFITQQLVEAMGGTIQASIQNGCFNITVELPCSSP